MYEPAENRRVQGAAVDGGDGIADLAFAAAVRELLSERGVSAKRIPKGDEMDPQTKLFWVLIGKLRQHGLEEEANKIFFLGLVEGMSRFDLLREFGQVILRVQRAHSSAAPELQKALESCLAEVRRACPNIKEDV